MIEATGAQIIVTLLERQGIKTIAGIPGGAVLPLYDELARSNIEHILVRQEQAAGFFAQGIARSTGNTAVCIATSGPGAMNLLTAIADARSDSIPLVAITGQVNTYLIGTDAFQEVDTYGLSLPITKHSVMVKSAQELLEIIPLAFELASSGRPGPVLIDVPRDIQLQKAFFDSWPEPVKPRKAAKGKFRSSKKDFAQGLFEAASCILKSKKPVLYLGGGANSQEASQGIKSLLDVVPMPAVSSLMGLGSVSTKDSLFFGMLGMHGSVVANYAMHEADLVLVAGARFSDRTTGKTQEFCPNAQLIHIDIDAAEINKIVTAYISIVADVESAIPFLTACIRERMQENTIASEYAHAQRAEWIHALSEYRDAEIAEDPYLQEGKIGSFISSLPIIAKEAGLSDSDMIVVTDVGQHQMWTAQYYPFTRVHQFLTSGSLGTMGFGLPTAIGAAKANPEKRVLCISGDGSIMMNIQELATLAELDLDVTVLILDNGALGMVRQQQELIYAKNYSASIFDKAPDLVQIGNGFNIPSIDTSKLHWEKLAFTGKGPRLVRHQIEQNENVYPVVPAGKANIEAKTAPKRTLENVKKRSIGY